MLDPDRLRLFMRTFFGYGQWQAPLWMVGMEEGGGEDLAEIGRRLDAWNDGDLEDLFDFHGRFSTPRWFKAHPPIQRTWGKLARIALAAEGRAVDTEAVRRYQRDELGRSRGRSTLIELFPLPSPSTKDWIYQDCGISEVATRDSYYDALREHRGRTIQHRIDAFRPEAVVFYGLKYRRHWTEIAGSDFAPDASGFHLTRRGPTLLILARHPVAPKTRNEDFERIGILIRESREAARR